jgi:hypothetical protein
MKTAIEWYQLLKTIRSGFGTLMMVPAKGHLACIPNALLKFCGAEEIKFIADHKTKKYIVSMEKATYFENSKNIATGSIQCPCQQNM